jgi:hypothetical protein
MLIPYSELKTNSALSTIVAVTLTPIPPQYAFLLQTISIDADPGSTQAVSGLFINAAVPGALPYNIISEMQPPQTNDISRATSKMGVILIPPETTFIASALFTFGINANAVGVSISGWLIPRGNLGSV